MDSRDNNEGSGIKDEEDEVEACRTQLMRNLYTAMNSIVCQNGFVPEVQRVDKYLREVNDAIDEGTVATVAFEETLSSLAKETRKLLEEQARPQDYENFQMLCSALSDCAGCDQVMTSSTSV